MTKPEIIAEIPIGAGKFLELNQVEFIDEHGRRRNWESCRRRNSLGAAIIIAMIRPDNEIILIRQFRPPTGNFVLEFPAGLIDAGETAAETAPRELLEETGYRGRVVTAGPPVCSSPGMSAETLNTVIMEVDGDAHRRLPPVAQPEENESIECFTVPLAELSDFLERARERGDAVDAKLAFFATGLKFCQDLG